jgi:hypothetical protein
MTHPGLAGRSKPSYVNSRPPTSGWLMRFVPVRWKRTSCADQRDPERITAEDELADEIGEALVVRVLSGGCAQGGYDGISALLPVRVEDRRGGVDGTAGAEELAHFGLVVHARHRTGPGRGKGGIVELVKVSV